ncbi:hypothetical protein B1729_00700 [Microbacterium sp. B35-04]|uniref:hypothetical protein n=1 Tax=unclassified Microbacterium TaxID=2609290 RepID=UPI0013D02288|nr:MULTISPECIES: hypothetical protein [unclassified Microbacterium]KAF2415213.1 hypothetical protein B1729_00700 [Microbacterium sp. B35-04]KAF2420662.1 hypothetical protein B2K11_01340 [Microbacterium sp. B35-30]
MKKKMIAGIAAGSLVALLSAPLAASAAPREYTTDPHGMTNGSVINPFGKTNGDTTNPYGSTNGETTNPFGSTNGDTTNPHTRTN